MLEFLSLLLAGLRRIAPAEWLVVMGLVWYGWVKSLHGVPAGSVALGLAGLIALLSLTGSALGYALFVPDTSRRSASNPEALPTVLYGHATGLFRTRRGPLEIESPATQLNQPVQVRWMGEDRPPHLAVLELRDLSPTLIAPTAQAGAWSLWYPGSQVRTGWVCAAGQRRYGLELTFVGKRLLLALDDEEAAEQIQRLMQSA